MTPPFPPPGRPRAQARLRAAPDLARAAPRPVPRARRDRGGLALAALALGAVALFSFLPLGRLAWEALAPAGAFDPASAWAELARRPTRLALWRTLETGLVGAGLAFALGLFVALALAVTTMRARRLALFLAVLSTLVAPQVVALAFLALAGPSSPLLATLGLAPPPGSANPLTGAGGIMLVLGLHHAPLVTVTLIAGLRSVPRALVEAAQSDGAGPFATLRDVVLPAIRPHLVASALLAFVASVGNFGIPALLGMPTNYLTLPTLIYQRLTSSGPAAVADASALSLLIAAVAVAGVGAAALLLRRAPARLDEGAAMTPFARLGGPLAPRRLLVEGGVWLFLLAALGLPVLSLLASALAPTYGVALTFANVTLDNFTEVLLRQAATARAYRNSALLSGGAGLLLALLAVPMAYALDRLVPRLRRPAEALAELPYAVPGIVLAVACILLFLKPLPVLGVSIYATPWILLFAYLARFLALALKPVLAAMTLLDPAAEEAASLDGARRFRRLREVVAPALWPAACAGGLLVVLLAFNELTVSALLWSAGLETLGVVLYGLEEAGLVSQAAAVALTTVAAVAFVMLVLDRLAPRLPPGVLPWRV